MATQMTQITMAQEVKKSSVNHIICGFIFGGGSAGGLTTLCALTFHDLFKAGASYYGVSDLAGLDAVLHNQDNREHDILDSDDYYQFHGGMGAAVQLLSGITVTGRQRQHRREREEILAVHQRDLDVVALADVLV